MKQTPVETIEPIVKKSRLATELEIMKRLHNISTRFVSENGSQDLLREIVETAVAITDADMGKKKHGDRDVVSIKKRYLTFLRGETGLESLKQSPCPRVFYVLSTSTLGDVCPSSSTCMHLTL